MNAMPHWMHPQGGVAQVVAAKGVLVMSPAQAERLDEMLKLLDTSLEEQFPNCEIYAPR